MDLFYDTLVPYMPDSRPNEEGKMVVDESLQSARKSMIALSEYQLSGNLMALYQAVLEACKFAKVDLIETVINAPKGVNIEDNTSVKYLLDESAKMLFKTINPSDNSFDINKFTAYVLGASHCIFIDIQTAQKTAEAEAAAENAKPAEIKEIPGDKKITSEE